MVRSTLKRHGPWLAGAALLGLVLVLRFGNSVAIALESPQPSRSLGTPARGELLHGKRLPSRGENFRAYSDLGTLLGRNAVHHKVRDVVLEAYESLAQAQADVIYVYGETGWPGGGRFAPHRTHQNGMAVDFFVPVRDAQGRPHPVPTHALNRFGYDLEFDARGRMHGYRIDYAAMAAHLNALHDAARRHGLAIEVVIFDPRLQPALFASPGGARLRDQVRFSRRDAWVRHDEHYHVVFVERG